MDFMFITIGSDTDTKDHNGKKVTRNVPGEGGGGYSIYILYSACDRVGCGNVAVDPSPVHHCGESKPRVKMLTVLVPLSLRLG